MSNFAFNPITGKLDRVGGDGGGGGGTPSNQGLVLVYQNAIIPDVTGDGVAFKPIFDTPVINSDGAYDTTTGIYTTPVTGKYYFDIQLTFAGLAEPFNEGTIISLVNGTPRQYSSFDPANMANKLTEFVSLSQSGVFELNAGDQLSFLANIGSDLKQVYFQGTSPNGYTSVFTIYNISSGSSGGGGGGISDVTATDAGASVSFETIGTTKNLILSDLNFNTFLGSGSGNSGLLNVGIGVNALRLINSGMGNVAIGYNCLSNLID